MSKPENLNRIRAYAVQRNLSVVGMSKNPTATRKLVAKLTPAQRRRLTRKGVTV